MLKRAIVVLALAAIVAVPFILRPHRPSPGEADDTLVVISPHNEAIRHEFGIGFARWYRQRTGRTVFIDWRNVGGTSDIARYLEGEYVASFQGLWTRRLGRRWSMDVQAGFQSARQAAEGSADARAARAAFLASDASCGIDVFFGGGPSDFEGQAAAGRLVDPGIRRLHPGWFTDAAFPERFGGETYRDPNDLWYGTVLSSYGIIYNTDGLRRLGFTQPPRQWGDLTDPRFAGEVGLCDPLQSGSIAQCFLNVIQQQIHRRVDPLRGAGGAAEAAAVRRGWMDAMRMLQLIGANARYFTDTSQKPPIDVADGNCAAGMCIDFYGREQEEAVLRRDPGSTRLGYVSPAGGAAYSVDPIALLRGAPHAAVARAFIEYVLSMDGQKLWNYAAGTPGGPETFALRRLPVRRDFYSLADWPRYSSDPGINPYAQASVLVPNPAWTADLWYSMRFIIRVMTEDTHVELARAWRAIIAAPEPRRSRALAVLQDDAIVGYDEALGPIRKGVRSRNLVDGVILARDIGGEFRRHYERAERIARGGE
ncbi:MAG TPA: extracellular solute-binding protein [Opitutaceae bacterium]|jgi:ABC-type Fe3+ transport system substrate-binding protein